MMPLLVLCKGFATSFLQSSSIAKHSSPSFLFVGGIVRDYILYLSLLGLKPNSISPMVYTLPMEHFPKFIESKNDIDISTILPPREAAKVLDKIFAGYKRSRKFATNIIDFKGYNIDCTSTRIDTECDGKNAKMEFGVSYFQDSFRRDFTFNAMYLSSDGLLFDFHSGIHHLTSGNIHFIGNAKTRILEDYTRIKRYQNFSKRFKMQNQEIETIIDDILTTSTRPIVMR